MNKHQQSLQHHNNKRGEWLVDNYFVPGVRANIWLDKEVTQLDIFISSPRHNDTEGLLSMICKFTAP